MQSRIAQFIAVALVLGIIAAAAYFGVAFFLNSPKNQPSQNTQNSSENSYTGASNATTGTVPSQQNIQSAADTDLQSAYDQLFQQILGQQVIFARASASSTGDAAAMYVLYSPEVTTSKQVSPGLDSYTLDVAFMDLGNDGISEALVYDDLPGFCGTAGCSLDIYQKQNKTWVKLFSSTVQGEVGLANVATRGYRDLFLSVANPGGSGSMVMRYVWDGKTYQPKETMATWSNGSFQVAQ